MQLRSARSAGDRPKGLGLRSALHVLATLILTACGASVAGFATEGAGNAVPSPVPAGPDGELGIDASAKLVSACPSTAPTGNNTCDPSTNVSACEYGEAALPRCDDLYDCVTLSGGSAWTPWSKTAAPCLACPASYDDLAPGEACDTVGAVCTYYQGTCGCLAAASSDAGTDGGTPSQGTWSCMQPQAGCPARRPRIGATCVHAMTCDYGSCLFGAELTFECASHDSLGSSTASSWRQAGGPPCP